MGNLIKPHEHKKKGNTISRREAETKHTQSVVQNLQTIVVGRWKEKNRTKNEYGNETGGLKNKK